MKTQNKQPSVKWPSLLLFVLVMILAAGVRTFAQAQEGSKQGTDLTEMSLEALMNIEVVSTATLTGTKPRLVPAAMTTVTAEQIKGSGARSLFELLDIYVPNLQVIRHHFESDHIGLRGIINDRDDKYLLLVNGRNMNDYTYFGALSERDMVLLQDIHHIDIVRGPGSALYGPGAIAMVVNIVTYNAETFQGTEVTTRMGAVEEFYSGELKHGQKFDDNDGGVFVYAGIGKYVGASKYDAPQIFPFTFPSESVYSWWDLAWGPMPDPDHLPADGTKAGEPMTGGPINRDGADARDLPSIKLHAQITRDNWDIWARYTRGGKQFVRSDAAGYWARWPYGYADWADYSGAANSYSYQQATGYIGYKQELVDNLDIDYAFSYKLFDYTRFCQNSIWNAYRENEYYGKIISRWQPNEQHKIALGVELSHRELGLPSLGWPRGTWPYQAWSTNLYSILGEWQWNINDKWTTFLGGRVDDHTYTNTMFSPRVAIVHTPTDKDTYKLMWSRAVRANNETEMKTQADACGTNSTPEKLDTIEFRYERQQSKNLDLAASIFMHYNFELVTFDESVHRSAPVGTQKDWGAELEASYHTEKTRLTLSHGYTKLLEFDLEPGRNTYATAKPYGFGDDLANWSNHITKLTAQQKLDDKWTLNASMRIYWGFPGLKDYDNYLKATSPASILMDDGWEKTYQGNYYLNLGLQYQASKDLTIGVTGYNLLGIFNRDFNKRNYLDSYGDYRCEAAAIGVSLEYKF